MFTHVPARLHARRRLAGVMAVAAAAAVAAAGCGSSSDSSGSGGASASTSGGAGSTPQISDTQLQVGKLTVDISKFCGSKPMKIGLIDGFGGNAWRAQVRKMVENEARTCPNTKEFLYFDSNLDPQKFINTINAWTAQGVNLIIAYDDYGQLPVPAFRKAQQAGVTVVTHNGVPGNATIPADVSAAVYPDWSQAGGDIADFMCANVNGGSGKGNLIHFAGPAGNLYDGSLYPAIKKALAAKCPGVKYLQKDPLVTNWDFGKTQQQAAAALNRYPKIDGITTSYTGALPSVYRAFQAAGRKMPPIGGNAVSNELVCTLHKQKAADRWTVLSEDGTGNMAPIALALGMQAVQTGEKQSGATTVKLAPYVNTSKGVLPKCFPDIPPAADLSNALTPEDTKALLKGQ
ncbi:MAG: ribose transport system substrate-binding protein [Solirubrobacteraceae bacterium]